MAEIIAASSSAAVLVSSLIKVGLILFNAPVPYFAAAITFDSSLLLFGLLIFSRQAASHLKVRATSARYAKSLLSQSWPYIISGLLISVYMKIDLVMIKEIEGDFSAGQYAAAARLSEACYFIPMTIVASLFPAILNAKSRDEDEYRHRVSNLYSLMFFLSVAISLSVVFFSSTIVELLYGSEYSLASKVLSIHVIASVFVFIGVSSDRWLLAEGLQKYSAINTFFGAAANVALNYLLIPRFGIEGAAWATLISYSVSAYFCLAIWTRTRRNFYLITRAATRVPVLKFS